MYDIIIIGAGAAGLTAAIYARRAANSVLVLESKTYGGQIIEASKIHNYPAEAEISGVDLAKKLYSQAKETGAEIEFENVIDVSRSNGIYHVSTDEDSYTAKAVIIATGTQNRRLNIENEERLLGHGISFCATCDGALFKDKEVMVVGGGNTAIQDVLYLSNICSKVYLVHRRNEFRADKSEVEKLENLPNVEIILSSQVTNVRGDRSLESVTLKTDDGTRDVNCSALFLAIGREPNTKFLQSLDVKYSEGFISAGEDCKTNIPGLFVAGDVRVKALRQIVTATADGAAAANSASEYITELKLVLSNDNQAQLIYNIGAVLIDLGPVDNNTLSRILNRNLSDIESAISSMRKLSYISTNNDLNAALIGDTAMLKLRDDIDTDSIREAITNERNQQSNSSEDKVIA